MRATENASSAPGLIDGFALAKHFVKTDLIVSNHKGLVMYKRRFVALPLFWIMLCLCGFSALCTDARADESTGWRLQVDCTRPLRGFIDASSAIPLDSSSQNRDVALWYPKWVPGSHGPGGPIANVAGLEISDQNGNRLDWRRTPGEVYRIEVQVPAGVGGLEVHLRYIVNQPTTTSFGHDCFFSRTIGVISPSCLMLYPEGCDIDAPVVETGMTLPAGWRAASALRFSDDYTAVNGTQVGSPNQQLDGDPKGNSTTEADDQSETVVSRDRVSLRTLFDSPIMIGCHYEEVILAEGSDLTPPHSLHVFRDTADSASVDPAIVEKYRQMVHQTSLLMGSHPFERFDILLGVSDELPKNGLEHSRSTFNVLTSRSLSNLNSLKGWDRLLVPHEYLHAWCGKYRRPQGMVRGDFHSPKDTELLWVYEGLTQYLGELIEARCGLMEVSEFEARLSVELRNAVHQDGRRWRTLADTGAASHILRQGSNRWGELRRSQDYYMEGMLFWLEVDALVRGRSGGKKTLDDFCRAFFKADDPLTSPKGYQRNEIIRTLNALAEFDWDGLIQRRIESLQDHFDYEMASRLGYRFEVTNDPDRIPAGTFRHRGGADFLDSIGLVLASDGSVTRVRLGGVADLSGLVHGDKIISIGERVWSVEAMEDAIDSTADGKQLELAVSDGSRVSTVLLDYEGGMRRLGLSRASDQTLLDEILAPREISN